MCDRIGALPLSVRIETVERGEGNVFAPHPFRHISVMISSYSVTQSAENASRAPLCREAPVIFTLFRRCTFGDLERTTRFEPATLTLAR